MTNQEAIEILKEEHNYAQLKSYVNEALELATEALEKQVPKKPTKRNPICYQKGKDGSELYAYEYHCPICNTKVNEEKHHCPCGQALDWSVKNDTEREIKVMFEDGDYLYTKINGSVKDIMDYYVGNIINTGTITDRLKKCVAVEFLN